MNKLLEVKNVSKNYEGFIALSDINLDIYEGQIIGLLGVNGSGKSTLLKGICELLQINEGEFIYNQLGSSYKQRRNNIYYTAEKSYIPSWMNIKSILKYYNDMFEDFDYSRCKELLVQMNISEKSKFSSLSKGNQERVQFIVTICLSAKIKCLDEPLGGVDPRTREQLLDILKMEKEKKTTYIMSTHHLLSTDEIFDRVIFIDMGRIVLDTTPEEILEKYNMSVNDFFKGGNYDKKIY